MPPSSLDELRKTVMAQGQGAMALNLAFIGVTSGVFESLAQAGPSSVDDIATSGKLDRAYVLRFCEAAFAFGYFDEKDGRYSLTDLGAAFRPDVPGTLMPLAVQAVLGAHMAERAAAFIRTGERPGERVLAERATILPWFGPMLEASFGPFFEREILPGVSAYREVDERGGVALDLGCGNGWYLRRMVARLPHLHGIGLDGFEENIRQARDHAKAEGLGARLEFRTGDIYGHTSDEPVDLVAMNRALHHVWDQRDKVFGILRDALKPGGVAVIWEPNWPRDLSSLRELPRRGMAFQNLSEHVQGNHFLRNEEIAAAFASVGMRSETFLFGGGTEAVVVGRR